MNTTISQHFDTKFLRGLAGVSGRRTRKQLLQEMITDVLAGVDMAKGLSGRSDWSGASTKLAAASEVMSQAIDLAETLPGVAFPKARVQTQMASSRLSKVDELSVVNPTAAREHILVCAAALAKSAELVSLFASRLNDAMEKSTESLNFHEDWLIKEFNGVAVIEKATDTKLDDDKRLDTVVEDTTAEKADNGEVDDDEPETDTDVNPVSGEVADKDFEPYSIAEKVNDIIAIKMLEKTGPKGEGSDWEKRSWGEAQYVKIPGTGWRRYSKKMQAQDKVGGSTGAGEWVKQFGLKPKKAAKGKPVVAPKVVAGKAKAKVKAGAKAEVAGKDKAKGKAGKAVADKPKAAKEGKVIPFKAPKYTIDKKAKDYARELLGKDAEDVINHLAAFKETLGPRGRGRDEAQLKRDFIANMKPEKYKDQKTFESAKKRMQTLTPKQFGIILAAINLDTEEAGV